MKNKIEVGMYVRTEKGIIDKIIDINEKVEMSYIGGNVVSLNTINIQTKNGTTIPRETKASHKIMDLIEENDLVEIEFYSLRREMRITRIFVVDYVINKDICFSNGHCQLNVFDGKWSNSDKQLNPIIKSILTHEQFNQYTYKVGVKSELYDRKNKI